MARTTLSGAFIKDGSVENNDLADGAVSLTKCDSNINTYWRDATKIQSVSVDNTAPTNHQYLRYDDLTSSYQPYTIVSATAPLNPINGDLWFNTTTNLLYYYDSVRLKWLSVNTTTYYFGVSGNNQSNKYLSVNAIIANTSVGAVQLRNSTVVAVFSSLGTATTTSFNLRINGVATALYTWAHSSSLTYYSTAVNLNLAVNDRLMVYVTTPACSNPFVGVTVAWRG
jgi:hypothetical protein